MKHIYIKSDSRLKAYKNWKEELKKLQESKK